MILGWMIYSILFGALCALAAHALESAARVMGRPSRWMWFVAMATTLGTSLMAMFTFVGGAIRLIPRRRDATWLDGPASDYIRYYDHLARWDPLLSVLLWASSAQVAAMFSIAIWRLVQRRRAWQRPTRRWPWSACPGRCPPRERTEN